MKLFMLGTMKRNPGLLDNNPTTETECRSWVDSKLRKEKFLKLGYNVEGKTEDILAIETGLGCIWGGVVLSGMNWKTKTPPQRGKLLFANANLSIIHMIITVGTEAGEVEGDEVAPESYNFGIWGA